MCLIRLTHRFGDLVRCLADNGEIGAHLLSVFPCKTVREVLVDLHDLRGDVYILCSDVATCVRGKRQIWKCLYPYRVTLLFELSLIRAVGKIECDNFVVELTDCFFL